jgi:hypothetical protein
MSTVCPDVQQVLYWDGPWLMFSADNVILPGGENYLTSGRETGSWSPVMVIRNYTCLCCVNIKVANTCIGNVTNVRYLKTTLTYPDTKKLRAD